MPKIHSDLSVTESFGTNTENAVFQKVLTVFVASTMECFRVHLEAGICVLFMDLKIIIFLPQRIDLVHHKYVPLPLSCNHPCSLEHGPLLTVCELTKNRMVLLPFYKLYSNR